MKIVLWRGYHEAGFAPLVARALEGGCLLIACPPGLADFSFLGQLPAGIVEMEGDWASQPAPQRTGSAEFPMTVCLGVFTSATTESAKLILYTRENVKSCARAIFALFDRTRITNVFCYPQPFHTFGLTLGYAAAHLFSWELTTPAGKYSREHHEAWQRSAGEGLLTLGTPTHFIDLAEHLGKTPKRSYAAIVGGARVTRDLWLQMRDKLNIEAPSIGYGASEASPGVSHLAPGREPSEDGEVGHPLPHLLVSVDPLTGVTFSGPSLCAAIVHDGILEFPQKFTLPDLMTERSDGSLVFQGRAQFTLNRGGRKILLEAVERELKQAFGIEALGYCVPDSRLGEELGLLLLTAPEKIDRGLWLEHLKFKFGMSFTGAELRAVSRFPLSANQKPDRRAALTWRD
jgi:acyl-CoA synthetase (AMP-forming)/AMP-acid ligase II